MKSILRIIINSLLIIIFIITIILSIAGGIIFYNAHNAFIDLKQGYNPIKIYDKDNQLVSTDSYYYEYSSLNDISINIVNAFIAVEDRSFYKHNGFSTKRIISSLFNNIVNERQMGASTITQQYIKNVYLTNEKTIERKANEIALAFELEKKYTKNQILEAYLNSILFGGNVYGINMASKYYFNKNPSDINISEAAYLAGMIQAPNRYNAFKNIDEANKRKNVVLKCMLEENYITQQEYNNEIAVDLKDLLSTNTSSNTKYLSSYLDYIYNNINYNDNPNKIYTYLNTDIQKTLYEIINNKYNLFDDENLNCSIIVLDNQNYGISGIAGNRKTDLKVINYATDVLLQPGSTIKPLLDYAPAIEYLDYTLATIIDDEPYTYQDGTNINNYDKKYLGKITLRKALSDSRNIPAVKLFNEIGYDKAFSFVNKLGLYNNEIYESDAIGGSKNGYTLLSIANAYQAFANLGYYKKASVFKKIEYNNYTYINKELPTLQMKPTTAWLINNVLHDVFKGSSYDLTNTYLMAKTGQTNYDTKTINKYNIPVGSTKDSLLIAYTKDITIGIWVGYNNISSTNYLTRYRKNIPRNIMKILLEKYALDNNYYEIIDGIIPKNIEIKNSLAYLSDNGYQEYFVEGTEPHKYYKENNKI